jgi:hypothetical protein
LPRRSELEKSASTFHEDLTKGRESGPFAVPQSRYRGGWRISIRIPLAIFISLVVLASLHSAVMWRSEVVAQAVFNSKEAKRLAAENEALAAKRGQLVRDLEDWRTRVQQEQLEIQRVTQEQIDAVELSLQQGNLYDASIELWTVGQMIEASHAPDQEQIRKFVATLTRLIDAAKQKHKERTTDVTQ